MTTRRPALSVIVCTHNRARDAIECVDTLLRAPEREEVEIIVIDNASSPLHAERLSQRFAESNVRLASEPVAGLSQARNRGLGLARAPWIAYLDDDAVPFADWIARALDLVKHVNESVGLIGGAVLPRWPAPDAPRTVPPTRLGTRWRDLLSLVEDEHRAPGSSMPMIVGCNLLVRRALLEELGGFASDLGRTPERLLGGEEIAIARAIAKRGFTVSFDAGLRVHHKISSERLQPSWIRKRAEAEGELLWKCAPSAMTKVLLSIPFLALASTLRELPTGKPRDYDHHVRLWHNLGFLKSAASAAHKRTLAITNLRATSRPS